MNVQARPGLLPLFAVIATWVVALACVGVMVVLDLRLADMGRSDLQQFLNGSVIFLIPILSAAIVGSALVIRRPHHPVGWLFLLLTGVIVVTGLVDSYAAYGAVARPGALPGAQLAAVIGSKMFVPWMMVPGLILLLTPSGRLTGRLTCLAAWAMVLGGAVAFWAGMLRPYNGVHASLGIIHNPLEVPGGERVLFFILWAGILAMHVGVVVGAGAVVVRFRRARARERQQLRWLGMAAIPFALFVLGAMVAAVLDLEPLLQILSVGAIAVVPLVVALSIEQSHLYDIDRLVSRAVTWIVLSAALIATYIVVVIFVGQSIGRATDSAIPAVVATLAAASVAGPLRRGIQNALDRRFNRRRFDTLTMLRAFTREPTPSMTVEQALRAATGDATLSVAYWIGEREAWVSEDGLPLMPAAEGVTVQRRGETVCVVSFDTAALDRPTVEAAAAEVRAELENARLRAAITLQLVEVRESRARIVEAQLAERHRIERDLHDGAQQRLLGLAMQLRAVELSGDAGRMQAAVATAVEELQAAVRDLRELANGLRPALLTDSGLAAALDELAARSPVPVRLETTPERFAPEVEETAWFIACEALTNAVKHAAPSRVTVQTTRTAESLRLVVADDGIGGAAPGSGSGLAGMVDRVAAQGGSLALDSPSGAGTRIAVELPCVS
jgi:signal transduction histidine kinase